MSEQGSYTVHDDVGVPMRDGVRLSAKLYVPDGRGPCPTVVNMMPYHKDGGASVGYNEDVTRYFAARGFAMVTVDVRGVACSDGEALAAFAESEWQDGYDLVEWAAAQPWSNTAVGMWGVSYGGITSLGTAAARPPHLKAIVPIHAATNMYWDYLFSHGCRVGFSPDVHWAIRMLAGNALPSFCDGADPRTTASWAARLERLVPWILRWHQDREGDSPAERTGVIDPSRITAATWMVGGWRDIFPDVAVRVFNQLRGPRRLLLGPWKHVFPDLAAVRPIGFLVDMARWWDRWLRDEPNGIDHEPPVTHYVYGADEWRTEQSWPPAHARVREWAMELDRSLAAEAGAGGDVRPGTRRGAGDAAPIPYDYTPLVGFDTVAMHWLAGPDTPQYPASDEAVSICFDSPPLTAPLEITGTPEIALAASATTPEPPLVGRLFDVDAAGRPHLVTLGWIRGRGAAPGTPDNGFRPGVVEQAAIPLRPISYRVPAGHRLRVTVSCADLSRIWPESRPFALEIHRSALRVPVSEGRDRDLPVPAFAPPQIAASSKVKTLASDLQVRRNLLSPAAALDATSASTSLLADGVTLDATLHGLFTVKGTPPYEATLRAEASHTLRRPEGTIKTEARMIETTAEFSVTVRVEADGAELFTRTWRTEVGTPPRVAPS